MASNNIPKPPLPSESLTNKSAKSSRQHAWSSADLPYHGSSNFLSASPTTSSPPSQVTTQDRQRYLELFNERASGQTHLSGFAAALILKDSGMKDADLLQIFEQTDIDRDGRLDREEFVRAMFLMEVRSGRMEHRNQRLRQGEQIEQQHQRNSSHSPSPSPCYPTTQGSPSFMHTSVEHSQPAHMPPHLSSRTRLAFESVTCNNCEAGIVPGDLIYFCASCNNISYCQSCHASGRRCVHNATLVALKYDTQFMSKPIGLKCGACIAEIKKDDI